MSNLRDRMRNFLAMDCLIGHLVTLNEALLQASNDFGVENYASCNSSILSSCSISGSVYECCLPLTKPTSSYSITACTMALQAPPIGLCCQIECLRVLPSRAMSTIALQKSEPCY